MVTKGNCKQCRYCWENLHPLDKIPGQYCDMFEDFSEECVLWRNEKPLITDPKDPLLPLLIQAVLESNLK